MSTRERYQNPVINDDLKLRLMAYNANTKANFSSIDKVEIYFLDPNEITELNKNGARLVKTITDVTTTDVGSYLISFKAEQDLFVIGQYIDVWYVNIENESTTIQNNFEIYPNLWFTTSTPIIYDFNFFLRPNRIKKGSKRWLVVEIIPNVPNSNSLEEYYKNLAIVADIKISIEQKCGPCMPELCDLRKIIENETIELREKCMAYYFLDTTDIDIGIYDVYFELAFGDCVYISEKQQLQID